VSEHTLVFAPGDTVAHVLDALLSPNDPVAEAMCGRTPWPSTWHGTGTQEELEKAMDLPLCVRCRSILLHRSGGR
jgi:hypothetical protein